MNTLQQSPNSSLASTSSFEAFKLSCENYIESKKGDLNRFLGFGEEVDFVIEDSDTFAFNPTEKKIIIPFSFIEAYYKNTQVGKGQNSYLHSQLDFDFGLYHEMSHFRDLVIESKTKGKKSMIAILTYVSEQQIKYGSEKIIPIGNALHRVCNCFDDIIVNTEVQVDKFSGFDQKSINGMYKYNMFADVQKMDLGDYIVTEDGRPIFVGMGKGTHTINTTEPVDYSASPLSNQFPNFLLRSFMVKDQRVIIHDDLGKILFKEGNPSAPNTWKSTLGNTGRLVVEKVAHYEKNGTKEEKERLKNLMPEIQNYLLDIESTKTSGLEKLFARAIQETGTKNRLNEVSINPINLIKLLQMSRGNEAGNHALAVTPALRYQIYKHYFLVIQKGLILIDLISKDLKEKKGGRGKGKGQKGKGEGKGEGEGEGKGEKTGEQSSSTNKDKDSPPQSGSDSLHVSPDIEEKLKLLEELEEIEEAKKQEKLAKKQVELSKFRLGSILDQSGVSQAGIETLNYVTTEYREWIEELVRFFLKELEQLDFKIEQEEVHAKKGKVDYTKVREYISSDPSFAELDEQRLHRKKHIIEKIGENFKKIDFTFAIDCSGSTSGFRGPRGWMNIIYTIISVALKQLEQHIQRLIEDPNYQIDVDSVFYSDGAPLSTFHSEYQYKNAKPEVKIGHGNDLLISLDGGTNDGTAWEIIAQEFEKRLRTQPDYTEEIINQKQKPLIVQIADTDVSENGVESLTGAFASIVGSEITKGIPIKRIILGNVETEEISQDEFLKLTMTGQIGNWDITYDEKTGKIIRKQISIKRRSEILTQVTTLFEGFFININA